MKKTLLTLALAAGMTIGAQAQIVTIFEEDMGTPSGTTAISSNTFENSGTLTYAGEGGTDVRTSLGSTGYTGASGGGNIYFTGSAGTRTFTISDIDTTGFEPSSFTLTFGARKNSNASTLSGLALSYSTDGISFTSLQFTSVPTGTGSVGWYLLSVTNADIIPVSNTLSFRWTRTSEDIRIDDVTLSGVVATAVPEPHEYAIAMAGLLAVIVMVRRRKASACA